MSSSRRGIQYDTVRDACDRLVASGVKPTEISLRAIHDETKTGSYTTIGKHYNIWLVEQQSASPLSTSLVPEDLAELTTVVGRIIERQSREIVDRCGSALAESRAEIERLREDCRAIADQNSEMEAALAGSEERASMLEAEVFAANKRSNELAMANADLRKACQASVDQASALRYELEGLSRSPVEQAARDRVDELFRSSSSPTDNQQPELRS